MSEHYPDQQQLTELELFFFDPERPVAPRVIIRLDREASSSVSGGLAAWEDVDSNCACE